MRKLGLFITLILILGATGTAQAQENHWDKSPAMNKLKRGFVNILTFPLEIPKQTKLQYEEGSKKTKHTAVHVASGFIKGLAYGVGRAGSGVWDVVTFINPVPENYEPLMKPEYVYNFRWTVRPPSDPSVK